MRDKLDLPWKFEKGRDNCSPNDRLVLGSIVDADGYIVARIWNDLPDALAKAEFLVRAANSYKEKPCRTKR